MNFCFRAKESCFSTQWNPYRADTLIVGCASNFGIIGNGRAYIVRFPRLSNASDCLEECIIEKTFDTQDGIFDVCWSEFQENHILTASGDGSVRLWDTKLNNYFRSWREHIQEVHCVNWNIITKQHFLSSSGDGTIKLWHPENTNSLMTFRDHTQTVYSSIWSPQNNHVFISSSADRTVKIWDIRAPDPVLSFDPHPSEVLSVDWNKYVENIVATGSVDGHVKVWDARFIKTPKVTVMNGGTCLRWLRGHEMAVRRVKFSPHFPSILGSVGYDMTLKVWDYINRPDGQELMFCDDRNTEFVFDLDWNLYHKSLISTASWDQRISVFRVPIE